MLEAGGGNLEAEAFIADDPALRVLFINLPAAAALVGTEVTGVSPFPEGVIFLGIPDDLGVGPDEGNVLPFSSFSPPDVSISW